MTLKADTEISTEDLIGAAKDMVANAATSARAPALALIDQLAGRLDIYHHGVRNFADMLEQHEYAHQFIGSGQVDLVRLDVALAQLTSHDNRAHAGHCVLQEAMNEAADLLATAPLFTPGEATMVLVNKAIGLLRERPSIRDGHQPTLVEQLVQQLEDATRQCALQADLLKEALPDVREGLAGTSAVDLAARIEDALNGKLPVSDSQVKQACDARDDFEKSFPLPAHVSRCGDGYAVHEYGAWVASDFVQMWKGWKACHQSMLAAYSNKGGAA